MTMFCGSGRPDTFDAGLLRLITSLLDLKEKPDDLWLYKRLLDNLLTEHKEKGRESSKSGGTETQILELHRKLETAISCLSGSQQNGGMGHTFDVMMDRKMKRQLRNCISRIASELGEPIKFVKPIKSVKPNA